MQKQTLRQKVIKNAFFQALSGVISKLGALVFTIFIARKLYPEAFGIYSLSLTIILTIVTLSDLGIGTAITRYIAESLGKKNKNWGEKEARSRFLFLLKFKVITSVFLAILLFVLASSIATLFKKPDLVLPLQIGSIYLIIVSFYGIISPLFLAIQKVKYATTAEFIFEISRVILIFIFLYFYKNVATVFFVLSISLVFALIYSIIIINKKYSFLIKGKIEPVERKRLLVFSGFLALNSLNIIIFTNIDKLMLGYFVSSIFVGYYTAIFTIISGVLGLVGFGSVIFPVFVQFDKKKLKETFKETFHYLAIIAFPTTIGLAYIILPLLKILYGQAYVPAEYSSSILITSILLSFLILEGILSSLYTMLFNAKEKPKWPALLMFISALINTLLNFIFIYYLIKIKPEYGLIGAALATFISRYLNLILLGIICKKKLDIYPNKNSILKPFLASLIILAFLIIYTHFFVINITNGIIMVLLAIIIYIAFIFLFKIIKKEDLKLLSLLK